MYGKTKRGHAYYVCAPKTGYVPPGHPGASSFWIREDNLLDGLNQFLATHVFGPYRHDLLAATLTTFGAAQRCEHAQRVAALRRAITDTDTRAKRLVRNLEIADNPDQDLIRDINQRRAELR